ncbi:hypothetical protein QBC46DRAFT_110265 [Diplogelasinospora grovesii]|uniref:DUF7726 domain-containing protein n=1 Tax=Diplogelasinospora grovesii TaxID=303347 RepID=A0AAN6N9V7_9PEZI|nr:hypothetical protein QBC46DRAFT_110265 [Diplogelasinospora grovesii]
MTENCDQVRRKINRVLDSGAITKTAFAKELGVSAKSLSGFLGEHGMYKGSGYAAYDSAWEFFEKRKMAGVPMPTVKKAKPTPSDHPSSSTTGISTSTSAAGKGKGVSTAPVDISDIYLDGEEEDDVSVYETCDEVRRRINAHLKKPGVTQAQFCRDIYAQLHGPNKPSQIQSSQLARFRGMKGPNAGATSTVFYAAYVFFEKIRIKEGKPKTKHRRDMEDIWEHRGGFDRERDANTKYLGLAGSTLYIDHYGQLIPGR